jgi:hypothetical protein
MRGENLRKVYILRRRSISHLVLILSGKSYLPTVWARLHQSVAQCLAIAPIHAPRRADIIGGRSDMEDLGERPRAGGFCSRTVAIPPYRLLAVSKAAGFRRGAAH